MTSSRFTVFVLLVFLLGGCAMERWTDRERMFQITEAEENRITREFAPVVEILNGGLATEPSMQEYVAEVGQYLAEHSMNPTRSYRFKVVRSHRPNVFVFPGGTIYLTRGMLHSIKSDTQLVALLAHQIAHVDARHFATQYHRGVFMEWTDWLTNRRLSLADTHVRDGDNFYPDLDRILEGTILPPFERYQERRADRRGTLIMARAGYSGKSMVGFKEYLLELQDDGSDVFEVYFKHHPFRERQIRELEDQIPDIYETVQSTRTQEEAAELTPVSGGYEKHIEDYLRHNREAHEAFLSGMRAVEQENFEHALGRFRAAVRGDTTDPEFHLWLGRTQMELGHPDRAQASLQRARALAPGLFRGYLFSMLYELEYGSPDRADVHWEEIKNRLPAFADLDYFKARILEQQNQRRQAISYYRRYLENVPEGMKAADARTRLRAWGVYQGRGRTSF